jgi:hypothetical protein
MAKGTIRNVTIGIAPGQAACLLAMLVAAANCAAASDADGATFQDPTLDSEAVGPSPGHTVRIELRRQNTDRGTADESSKTTLRLETALQGPVARLRLDLQFPDDKTTFSGDPFQPRMGDTKLRAYFRPFRAGNTQVVPDIELTFPTADPSSLGAGKYQFSAALHSVARAPAFIAGSGQHRIRYEWDVRQTVSVAGDASRQDINNTKPELALRDSIGSRHWLKLTFKPTIDWVQSGKTGAVLELEGGWSASPDWRFSMMGGGLLWGEGVPGTYHRRLELVAGHVF